MFLEKIKESTECSVQHPKWKDEQSEHCPVTAISQRQGWTAGNTALETTWHLKLYKLRTLVKIYFTFYSGD